MKSLGFFAHCKPSHLPFPLQEILPLLCRDLHVVHHGSKPQLAISADLNNLIFAGRVSGIPFVLGQHLVAHTKTRELPCGSVVKNLPAMQETWVLSLGQKDPLEKEMAIWQIPWTEESGRLQSIGTQLSN